MLFAFPTLTHAHPDSQSAGLTRRPSHHPETNRYRNLKKLNGMLSAFHYIQSRWQKRHTIKDAISNNVTKMIRGTPAAADAIASIHTPSSRHQMGRRYSQKSRTTLMSPAFSNHVSSKNEAPQHCTHCAWHFHTTSHGSTNARTWQPNQIWRVVVCKSGSIFICRFSHPFHSEFIHSGNWIKLFIEHRLPTPSEHVAWGI